jgi:hypothetical protein
MTTQSAKYLDKEQTALAEEQGFVSGLDLGKLSDPSAFALFDRRRPKLHDGGVEIIPELQVIDDPLYGRQITTTVPRPAYSGNLTKDEQRKRQWKYRLARMKCWDVGTDYDKVLEWLVAVYSREPHRGGLAGTTLAIDYTGVGVAVVEWLQKEMRLAKAKAVIRPIWIQAGNRSIENSAGGWNVPKKELVSVLQVLMGTRRLTVEEGIENCVGLLHELDNFKVKQNKETGHESYECWRENIHDDKVLACCVGLWVGEQANKDFWVR